jgi:hypothetical protein
MLITNFNEKYKWISMIEQNFPAMKLSAEFISNSDGRIAAKEIPFKRMVELGLLIRKKGKYKLGFPNG